MHLGRELCTKLGMDWEERILRLHWMVHVVVHIQQLINKRNSKYQSNGPWGHFLKQFFGTKPCFVDRDLSTSDNMIYYKHFYKALSALRDTQCATQHMFNPPTIAQHRSHHHTLLPETLDHRVTNLMMRVFEWFHVLKVGQTETL